MDTGDPTAGGAAPPHMTARRLVRRTDHRLFAGVAGGIADYTGIDPVIFRVLFIFLSFTGGVGIFLYLLGWVLLPRAGEDFSPGERFVRRFRRSAWIGIALLIAAAFVLARDIGIWRPAPFAALALIVIGIVLLREDPPRQTNVGDAGSLDERHPVEDFPPSAAPTVPISRPRRPRSPLGYITVAAALIVVGAAAVLANLGIIGLDFGDYFALALVVLGAGLLVAAWWGRARLLILIGLLLAPAVLAASLIGLPFEGGLGVHEFRPHTLGQVNSGYQLAAGRMEIDLSDVPFRRGDVAPRMDVSMAVGELDILVPRSVLVYFTGQTQAGELWAFGKNTEGVDLEIDRVFGEETSGKKLFLDVNAGLASVSVHWNDYYYGDQVDYPKRAKRDRKKGHRSDDSRKPDGRDKRDGRDKDDREGRRRRR